jgi:hypothetical protein
MSIIFDTSHRHSRPQTFSTGRGGAGNIRSPSRDVNNPLSPNPAEEERDVIREHVAAAQDAPVCTCCVCTAGIAQNFISQTQHSTGRGGVGNIANRSRSRGPAQAPAIAAVHSTGRGGAGNILTGDAVIAEAIDEEERRKHSHPGDALYVVSCILPGLDSHIFGLQALDRSRRSSKPVIQPITWHRIPHACSSRV